MLRLFDSEVLLHAFSGSLGGVVTLALFFPLDSLRTRLQVGDCALSGCEGSSTAVVLCRVARAEGLWVLYRGFGAVTLTMGISNFVYFYAYIGLKHALLWQQDADVGLDAIPMVSTLVIAASAGILNVLITTPLWLVNTRMKVQTTNSSSKRGDVVPYANLFDGLVRVAREEGLSTLWDGTWPSLILVSNPAIVWVVYERLKWSLIVWHASNTPEAQGVGTMQLMSSEYFLLGAFSKAIATLITYPLQLAQTRLRYNHGTIYETRCMSHQQQKRYSGTVDCLWSISRSCGVWGLYRGLEAKLWQTVLTAAFQFLLYEQLVSSLLWVLSILRDLPG